MSSPGIAANPPQVPWSWPMPSTSSTTTAMSSRGNTRISLTFCVNYLAGRISFPMKSLSSRMRADIYCWTRSICTLGIASSASIPANMYEGSSRLLHGQFGWLASDFCSSLPETTPSFRSSGASTAMSMRTTATMPRSWWNWKVLTLCSLIRKPCLCLSKSTESTWRSVSKRLKAKGCKRK